MNITSLSVKCSCFNLDIHLIAHHICTNDQIRLLNVNQIRLTVRTINPKQDCIFLNSIGLYCLKDNFSQTIQSVGQSSLEIMVPRTSAWGDNKILYTWHRMWTTGATLRNVWLAGCARRDACVPWYLSLSCMHSVHIRDNLESILRMFCWCSRCE